MSTHAQQFAERCASAIAHHLPEVGHGPEIVAAIAGSYDAFQLMLYQQAERKHRVPPMREEVAAYLKEIDYPIDPDEFMDFYGERGWLMSNGKKLQDWCCALRRWKRGGWGQTKGRVEKEMSASLGALQIQLEKVREEIQDIRRPGGSAHPRPFNSLSPEDQHRYQHLLDHAESIKARIEGGM